ncbi:MAG: hypothetical protein MUP47_06430 [Phycisphaerae bacterium]|nr:hypothetical protein [Phycisphaerae bacterium]
MRTGLSIVVFAVVLGVVWPLLAVQPRPDTPAGMRAVPLGRPDLPAAPAAPAAPATEPSLLLERGPVPITTPTQEIPLERPPRVPVPESMVIDARCRLTREAGGRWSALQFLDDLPGGFPSRMRVLPGRELELLERLVAEDATAEFRVTGQTTSYRDKAYILPLSIAKDVPIMAQPAARPPAPVPEVKAPQAQGAPVEPTSPDEAERIRSSLMKNRPAKPIVPAPAPRQPPNPEPGVIASSRQPAAPPAGDILINRTIRIARSADGQWMEARFEADNTLQEQPVPLLPCQVLERAETIDGKLRITGVLRRYKGRDYLLLRKALADRDMGQF